MTQADIDAIDLQAVDLQAVDFAVDRPLVTAPTGEPVVFDEPRELLEEVPDKDLAGLVLVAAAAADIVTVLDEPGGAVTHTLDNPIPSGGPLVFVVDEFGVEGWHRVLLPNLPV